MFLFFFRCESGYTGQHCEKTDFSILYVVPSRQKLTHVLIAAIIGAVQIAIIVAIVMCITRWVNAKAVKNYTLYLYTFSIFKSCPLWMFISINK